MEICGLKEAVNKLKETQDSYLKDELDEAIETILAELKKKDTELTALQMEHEHDLKMIDEVKGEAVKLYNEIEQVLNDYQELGKDYHHLGCELEKKEKIIDELVKTTVKLRETSNEDCFIPRSYRDINDCIKTNCADCIIEYFKRFFKKESRGRF